MKKYAYELIVEHIVEQIRNGTYSTGKRLSVRKCARIYGVSVAPVIKAFEILKTRGVLEPKERSGTVVSKEAYKFIIKNTPDWQRLTSVSRQSSNSKWYNETANRTENPDTIKLTGLSLDEETFYPQKLFAGIKSDIFLDSSVFTYTHTGMYTLREALARHLERYVIKAEPEEIIVFNSNIDAMSSIFSATLHQGMDFHVLEHDIITTMGLIPSFGCTLNPIEFKGLRYDFDRLKSLTQRRPDGNFLYLHGHNNFFSGKCLSSDDLNEIIKIAEHQPLPILEADFTRDLWVKEPLPPVKSSKIGNQVFYVGNFSHMAYIGLRLAWAVVPKALIGRIIDIKTQLSGATSSLLERIAYELLVSNRYVEYMEEVRSLIPARIEAVDQILCNHLHDIAEWSKGDMTVYVWLKLKEGIDAEKIFSDCPEVCFGAHKSKYGQSYILIHTLSPTLDELDKGLEIIAAAARKQLN